jgi:hypothetical protein
MLQAWWSSCAAGRYMPHRRTPRTAACLPPQQAQRAMSRSSYSKRGHVLSTGVHQTIRS